MTRQEALGLPRPDTEQSGKEQIFCSIPSRKEARKSLKNTRQTNPNKGNRVNEEAACLDDKSHRKQRGVSKFSGVPLPAEKQQMTENYRRLKTSSYLRCLQVKSFVFIQQLIRETKQKENLETPSTLIFPTHGPFCPAAPNQIIKC